MSGGAGAFAPRIRVPGGSGCAATIRKRGHRDPTTGERRRHLGRSADRRLPHGRHIERMMTDCRLEIDGRRPTANGSSFPRCGMEGSGVTPCRPWSPAECASTPTRGPSQNRLPTRTRIDRRVPIPTETNSSKCLQSCRRVVPPAFQGERSSTVNQESASPATGNFALPSRSEL